VKIRGTCRRCGREFLVQQVLESQGHCPWCGQPFQPQYTAVLAEALQQAEAAGSSLENALEKIAGMGPALVLDEDSVLGAATAHLERLRDAEKRSV
jgi:hypothetical protein